MEEAQGTMTEPKTIGALKEAGYKVISVKQEMRKNLIQKLKEKKNIFDGIMGYDETVIPYIMNAVLSCHDIILLGERGQAKSRIMRSLIGLLDEYVPVIDGCEINDDPFNPQCKRCKELVEQQGDETAVGWISREQRYSEKLATPDITINQLVGDIDPIKVAEGRYLADLSAIHFGLLPRANRGVFGINELPDLEPKIQVALFNVMEERDIDIGGFKVRLPLDVLVIATANPEDYTNRGRIVTPLKDRFGSQIRTHYPTASQTEIAIAEQERNNHNGEYAQKEIIPPFMKRIIAEISQLARKEKEISQSSGVSVRMTIHNLENLCSYALRAAIEAGEDEKGYVPRISHLRAVLPSSTGKVELEYGSGDSTEEKVISGLIDKAVKVAFDDYFKDISFDGVVAEFIAEGQAFMTSANMKASTYESRLEFFPELKKVVLERFRGISGQSQKLASCVEFVLDGLHQNKKLNKKVSDTGTEMMYLRPGT